MYARPKNRKEFVGWYEPHNRAGACEMLPCHWNELVVLHELAHVLASARFGSTSHDPAFARVYLELVALVMGPSAYVPLYEAFEQHGVNHDWDDTDRLGQARRMPPPRRDLGVAGRWLAPGARAQDR